MCESIRTLFSEKGLAMKTRRFHLGLAAIGIFLSLTGFHCRPWCPGGHGGHGGSAGQGGTAAVGGASGAGGIGGVGGIGGTSGVGGASGDLPGTPGDDRAGWVVCDPASDGIANATPGSVSCEGTCYEVILQTSTPICAQPPAPDSDDTQECDGPEDCGPGLRCCATEWTMCQADCFAYTRCHVDADCPGTTVCKPGRVPSAHGAGECAAP